MRKATVGDDVTYVVNRNINFTNVCYTGCRFCAFAQRRTDADAYSLSMDEVGQRAEEAWVIGATEVCMQGGIHPDLPGTAYADLVRAVKDRVPDMHVHAYSPMEIVNGSVRTGLSIEDFLISVKEAGLDSIPGTAAEILDDDVRWILTKGKLPTASWIEVISTAHKVGLPSSSTMMYGHVDAPHHWVQHLRTIAAVQDQTGGFTEFVLLPFIHQNSPIYLAGVARPGPTYDENRAVHAMARIMLHGRIDNIQCSWVKLGVDGCVAVLNGGVNDIGGTLMEETISRMAGSKHGSRKSIAELTAMATAAGRPARQRTTTYGDVPSRPLTRTRLSGSPVGVWSPAAPDTNQAAFPCTTGKRRPRLMSVATSLATGTLSARPASCSCPERAVGPKEGGPGGSFRDRQGRYSPVADGSTSKTPGACVSDPSVADNRTLSCGHSPGPSPASNICMAFGQDNTP